MMCQREQVIIFHEYEVKITKSVDSSVASIFCMCIYQGLGIINSTPDAVV